MSNPCQILDCPQVPLYSYTIEGQLPTPTPPTPPAFTNAAVTQLVCEEGDEPSFAGELPGWITFSSEDRQFTGAPGVWGGDTQDQANAIAAAQLAAFITEHENDIICSGIDFLFTWDSVVVVQGDGTASFSPPQSSTGNTAVAAANVDVPSPGSAAATFNATGSMTWNSDAEVPANLHIISTGAEFGTGLAAWAIEIRVVAPLTILLGANSAGVGLNVTTDLPFDLPDTGGADWVIEWDVIGLVDTSPGDGGTLSLSAEVSIV